MFVPLSFLLNPATSYQVSPTLTAQWWATGQTSILRPNLTVRSQPKKSLCVSILSLSTLFAKKIWTIKKWVIKQLLSLQATVFAKVCLRSSVASADKAMQYKYRVGQVVADLGLVDLDLGSSLGWWAAPAATYCPSRMVKHTKSKSTQPRSTTTCPTLYFLRI